MYIETLSDAKSDVVAESEN